jgi:hypothetical protein
MAAISGQLLKKPLKSAFANCYMLNAIQVAHLDKEFIGGINHKFKMGGPLRGSSAVHNVERTFLDRPWK